MCMGRPEHVHSNGESTPVESLVDRFAHSEVSVNNLKIREIHHMEFEPSELFEYIFHPQYETLHLPALSQPQTFSHEIYTDEKLSHPSNHGKTTHSLTVRVFGEKCEGLPLPVTTTRKETGITRLSKVMLFLTALMLLSVAQQLTNSQRSTVNTLTSVTEPMAGTLASSYESINGDNIY